MVNEVIPLEDVSKVITDFTNKDFERAIVLLLLHGMSAKIIRNLKIKDLLTSCSVYFEEDEITLEQLLAKDPLEEEMIAFWDVSGSKPHFLCSGPQALFFIFQHLQRRIKEGRLKSEQTNDYLLVNTAYTQLHKDYVTNWLNPKDLKDSGISSSFKARNLNYTFKSYRDANLPDDEFRIVTIKLFEGKYLNKFEKHYPNQVLEDNTIFIKQFKEILPSLTVELDYDLLLSHTSENSVDNVVDTHFSNDKTYSNDELYFLIKDYYKNHIQDGPIENYEEYDFIVDYVYGLTVDHVSLDYFEPEKQMPRLFKRAELELLFKNQAIIIKYNDFDSFDALLKEVMNVIYDSGASSIVPIVEDTFKEVFFSSLYNNHQYEFEYGKDIIITSADILDSLHAYGI